MSEAISKLHSNRNSATMMEESTTNEAPVKADETNKPDDEIPKEEDTSTSSLKTKKNCCDWRHFEGKAKAQGFAFAATGHGSLFVTNAFLSSSLIYLASQSVGCVDEELDEIIEDCNERVYGFTPSSLVTNIATIASLSAALFLPLVGAIIDYTPHRKRVGKCVALSLVMVQAVLIGTVSSTWFIMSIVQATGIALYQMHYSIASSYLPDVARYDVDAETFSSFNRIFFTLQFGGEAFLLIFTVALATAFGLGTVQTAQLGQALGAVWLLLAFGGAWNRFPALPHRRPLPPGHWLVLEGFRQNARTAKAIVQHHPTFKWFLLAVVFGEAGSSALIPIMLTLLTNQMKYSATEVGIAFLLALFATLPGIATNSILTRRLCPAKSAMGAMTGAVLVTTIAMVHIPQMSPDLYPTMGNLYCILWGFFIGWWYASEQLLFSFLLPAGQESELTGFFVYCMVIFLWFPPLVYSIILNHGRINESYGLSSLMACQGMAFVALACLPPWPEALKSASIPLVVAVGTPVVEEETSHEMIVETEESAPP